VTTWVGGFDILYACQDVDFDRRHGLRSIPATYGVSNAIRISRLMHLATVIVMASLWWAADLPPLYLAGVAIVATLLTYEQSLVSDDDHLADLDRPKLPVRVRSQLCRGVAIFDLVAFVFAARGANIDGFDLACIDGGEHAGARLLEAIASRRESSVRFCCSLCLA